MKCHTSVKKSLFSNALKAFLNEIHNTQEKDEKSWRIFIYVLYIVGRNKSEFDCSPIFLFVAWNSYWSRYKRRFSAHYRC